MFISSVLRPYYELKKKFIDKGMEDSFRYLVVPPPAPYLLENPRYLSVEKQMESYAKSIVSVFHKEWDYWNTWIDYQQHRF